MLWYIAVHHLNLTRWCCKSLHSQYEKIKNSPACNFEYVTKLWCTKIDTDWMSHYVIKLELGTVYAKLLQEQNPIRRWRVVPTGQVGNWTLSSGHKLLSVHWHLHSPNTSVSLYPRAHHLRSHLQENSEALIIQNAWLYLLQSVPVVYALTIVLQ